MSLCHMIAYVMRLKLANHVSLTSLFLEVCFACKLFGGDESSLY